MAAFWRWLDDLTSRLILEGWLPVRRRDRLASFVIVVSLAGGLLAVFLVPLFWPNIEWTASLPAGNRGFGPEWQCVHVPQAEDICIRKPAAPP